jgi:hypothetical protein
VTTSQNTLSDPSQVDLNAFGPDVNENHLKASVDAPRILHHLQGRSTGNSFPDIPSAIAPGVKSATPLTV